MDTANPESGRECVVSNMYNWGEKNAQTQWGKQKIQEEKKQENK